MRKILPLFILLFLSTLRPALAVTALGVGYYQADNAAIVQTTTWTTSASTPSYGGKYTWSTNGSAKLTLYTDSTVGRIGIYYLCNTGTGGVSVAVNGVLTITQPCQTVSGIEYNNYLEFTITPGANYIDVFCTVPAQTIAIHGFQLLAPLISVSVSFPTHTPTPAPTAGPSPTPTANPADYLVRSTVVFGDQSYDVAFRLDVTPADYVLVSSLVVIIGLLMLLLILFVRRTNR